METVHRVSRREAATPAVSPRDYFLAAVQQGWVAAFAGRLGAGLPYAN
jgi:hypothetical protein